MYLKSSRCEMEPAECHAVIRLLQLKGRTQKETFDEIMETYGDDAPSYDLVKHCHREFKQGRQLVETVLDLAIHRLSLMRHLSVISRPPFWTINALLFAKQPKRSRLVQGIWKLNFMTINICIRCLLDGFPGCSQLSRSMNASSARGCVRRHAKALSQIYFKN